MCLRFGYVVKLVDLHILLSKLFLLFCTLSSPAAISPVLMLYAIHIFVVKTLMLRCTCMLLLYLTSRIYAASALNSSSALTLVGQREMHLARTKLSDKVLVWISIWSKVQMICLWSSWCHCHSIVSCFTKIQNASSFLVLAYPDYPRKEAVKWALWLLLCMLQVWIDLLGFSAHCSATDRYGLLLQMLHVVWLACLSVCLSVCHDHFNWLRCHLGYWPMWAKETVRWRVQISHVKVQFWRACSGGSL